MAFATSSNDDHAAESASASHSGNDVERVAELARARTQITREIQKRIVGQDRVVELLLIATFARGHGLFVGVPGLAKTLLITTLAQTLSLRSNRIQFTPDLMPSDITGTDVLDEERATGQRSFRFVPGPVFTNILLADEINRTPPKTQAALLESMAEGRVSAGGRTYELEKPYLVFATQNPIEQEGTYPLPEAQLDRFLVQIDVGYPSRSEEEEIVLRTTAELGPAPVPVLTREQILNLQALIPRIPVAPNEISHAVALARASRPDDASAPVVWPPSPCTHGWWIRMREFGSEYRLPLAPAVSSTAATDAAWPMQYVCTSGLMNCIVS